VGDNVLPLNCGDQGVGRATGKEWWDTVAVQRKMAERNVACEPKRRMQFRIGINIGDVIYDEARIYGDGLNIAARLEAIAQPGGIVVSRQACDQVEGKLALSFRSLGLKHLKNIAKPIEVRGADPRPGEPATGDQLLPGG